MSLTQKLGERGCFSKVLCSDSIDLPGQAGYLSRGGPAMKGAFLGCLVDGGDSQGQGCPSLGRRFFADSGPDFFYDILDPCAV